MKAGLFWRATVSNEWAMQPGEIPVFALDFCRTAEYE